MIGDSGYNGEPNKLTVWKDEHAKGLKKFIGRVCARQETFFKGLKDWKILRDRFAYGKTTKERMELHKMVVEAIAVIRQYDYENGHPPFEVCQMTNCVSVCVCIVREIGWFEPSFCWKMDISNDVQE